MSNLVNDNKGAEKPPKHSHRKSTITFSFLTVISRVTGLFKWILLAAALGLTRSQDAFNVAHVLPNMIYEIILGGIITSALIPIFVPYLENDEKKKEGWRVVNTLFSSIILWLGLLSVLACIFSPFLIYLQTLLEPEHKNRVLAIYFFRFFAFSILLYGLSSFFSAILNAYHKFGITAAAPIINNIVVIITLALFMAFPGLGLTWIVIGTMLGVLAMALVQVPQLIKLGWKPRFIFSMSDPIIKQFILLGAPVAGYALINQIGFIVRTNLAYPIPGGFSALQIGFTFFNLPYGIFAVAVTTVIFPTLSKKAINKNWEDFKIIASRGYRWIALALFPSSVLMFFLSKPAVILLMEYGRFTGKDADFLARVISAYALGIVPFGFFMFLTRLFYALKDTRFPMYLNIIGVLYNIMSNIFFMRHFGVEGIALNAGITYFLMDIIGVLILSKRIGYLGAANFSIPIFLIGAASVISGLAVYLMGAHHGITAYSRHINAGLNCIIPALLILLIYGAIIVFLKFIALRKSKIIIF